jgi:hypothetical protein
LSPAVEDEIWARLRSGHAAKPTARALGISTSGVHGYLVRCGGIRPAARLRPFADRHVGSSVRPAFAPKRTKLTTVTGGGFGPTLFA